MSEQQNEAGPDGGGEGAEGRSDDLVSRSELTKAAKRRDDALAKSRQLEQDNAELRAKLETRDSPPKDEPKTTPDGVEAPPWAKELTERFGKFETFMGDMGDVSKRQARETTIGSILEGVPDGNKDRATTLLLGLEAQGKVDLGNPSAVDAAREAIGKASADLYRDPTRGAVKMAPQRGPDGSPKWGQYETFDEVPKDLMKDLPDKEFDRLDRASSRPGVAGKTYSI